jgi:2-dehydro-3-deoxyphosphooctonate aldolase (KDO 8-P synthase)
MPKSRTVKVGDVEFRNEGPLAFIAGPCSLESEELLLTVGTQLKKDFAKLKIPFVLKCSFDKANRTSIKSYRGPGLEKALDVFSRIKKKLGVPMLTDVHETWQVGPVSEVVDILQIPAFLSRQTDLLVACGKSGKAVNIKKGQFLAPWDLKNAVEKVESTGNTNILVCERGTSFGYGNLIVDMRGLEIMRDWGYPVVYDATHSVQLPGAQGTSTGGQRHFAMPLSRGAVAVGIAGLFLETHPDPEKALSDGPNSLYLRDVPAFVRQTRAIDALVKPGGSR